MEFMTWTLSRPTTGQFDSYYKLKDGESWNSKEYELVDPEAVSKFSNEKVKGFVQMLEKYPEKFASIGMHEFGISDNGDIFNMGYGQIVYPNGYYYNDPNKRVLNTAEDDIELPVPTSLRYFMHKYPKIRWAIQLLATANLSGDRVTSLLNNDLKPLFDADTSTGATVFVNRTDANGNVIYVNAQDELIRQSKLIAQIYLDKGFPISDIEIDMEKTWSNEGEDQLFADLLARVKREVCLPLGLGLRVNLFAMTGDYTPSYYGWHNYETVAKAEVNGVQAVDEFQLMTYDFSWGGSSPGASTPLWWLEQVLEHVKDVEDRGLWKAEDVYVGNAGYGRRWSLNEERMGVTFDFKQMVQMQNGSYIHNDGTTVYPNPDDPSYSEFPFRDQDFIPFAGYNDPDSDYQINYPHVYDRFTLSSDGGAGFKGVNRAQGGDYVTNYSLTQRALFTDVLDYKTAPDSLSGRTEVAGVVEMSEVKGDLPVTNWTKYRVLPLYLHPDTGLPTGLESDKEGRLVYNLNATGTFNLIVQVTFPFYDKSDTVIYVDGVAVSLSAGDWYSISLMQKDHFFDLGQFTSSAPITVEVGNSNGVIIGGVVAVKGFEHNLSGGDIILPTSTYPFMRRGDKLADGSVSKVKAQFPDSMDLVGEVLRRPPRPAIIWEDIFASYVNTSGEGFNILNSGYYKVATEGGYTEGSWTAHIGSDYSHARTDSRLGTSQFMLNAVFISDIMVEAEVVMDSADDGLYGLRLLAEESQGTNNGYLALLDHAKGEIRLVWQDPSTGVSTTEYTVPMSLSLQAMKGQRITLTAYVLKGKISIRVNDRVYINEYTPSRTIVGGAFGLYVKGARAKLYRYTLSSLERFERMERLEITVDGVVSDIYGAVERTVPLDEYGFLIYNGYPADLSEAVKNPSDADGESVPENTNPIAGTILETETVDAEGNRLTDWSRDYQNKLLAEIAGWVEGSHEVVIRMLDAGIWFRRFYVGDSEGMSISYNSDKVGFIRTATMITDYGCKGIAMWTLGQEDPTIYTYLPDSWVAE